MSRSLQTDELGNIFEVLAEDELLTFGYHGDVTHAELEQTLAAARVVQDVDMLIIDAFARKKLFRPEAAASSRLREEDELLGDSVHGLNLCRVSGTLGYSAPAVSVKANCEPQEEPKFEREKR